MTGEALAALIGRAKARDVEALDALIDHFGPRIFGFLFRLTGSRHDAEEMLQDVFVRLVRNIGRYEHDGQFEAWLFRIAGNLVRDRVRRLRRRPAMVSIDESSGGDSHAVEIIAARPTTGGGDAEADRHEKMDKLQSALTQLPDAEREVVLLRHFSQMSFAEIAAAMDTPLGTALARAHRGLNKLRALMDPNP
ncbi:MAG: sigma-70 family RNA polymerase sigma factor [Phycisphaerales bacterium]|nr:sigma-70 family RNA polymerase sigma factor [Phycisphaerales bacterium]